MNPDNNLLQKLETVLRSFMTKNFCKNNNAQLGMLVTHLSKEDHVDVLQTPVVLAWIDRCVNTLLDDFSCIHHTVISFMINLCAIVTDNEWLIIGLHEKNTVRKITTIVNDNFDKLTPSIKLAHIRLLKAVSNHSIGLQWMKKSKSWRYLIKYCSGNHTLYVVREASNLLCDILHKFSTKTYDEELCLEILGEILKPINQNVYEDSSMIVNVDDTDVQKELVATLDLISMVFQKNVESNEKSSIPHLCEVHHKLETNIWKLAEMTHNEYFLGKIFKAQTSYNFALLIYEKWKINEIDPLDFNRFGVEFFNIMKCCIARRNCVNFLKLTKFNHHLWKKLGCRAPSEISIENEIIQFENQLVMFQVLPVLCIVVKTQKEEEDIFNQYLMKLFSISSEFTIRICYSFRDILLDCPDLSAHLAYKSIHEILSMNSILNKDQAVLIFQALIYVLKEFAMDIHSSDNARNEKHGQKNFVLSIPQVLYATLVCVHTLVKKYNITWKDSIETMCLTDIVLLILKNPNLTTLMVVQAIKLAQLSVEHFHSPNMALLVDNLKGSGLQNLGPIIIKNLYNIEWEVRDSILELVTSVVSISRLKFPAFQQYILDNDICSLVCSIVKNDEESYVRASGLKCLSQMISVNVLWEQNLIQSNLIDHLLWIVCNESEGIVRKEAIACITQMYVHRRISSPKCITLYRTLAHCAVHDLYWEVKVCALNFWDIEIFQQFTNQGMIDGTFPTVTFSKENKKIVTLTEAEILLRINKILNELSQIGCLDVILKCLEDECDFEAVKFAVKVVQKLFEKLEKYDYEKALGSGIDNNSNKESLLNVTLNDDSTFFEFQSNSQNYENMKSNVINDIVSTSDIQLLINSYKTQMNVGNQNNADVITRKPNKVTAVSPQEFVIRIKAIDVDKLIENRNNWFICSENLSSLLDDMILSSENKYTLYSECY